MSELEKRRKTQSRSEFSFQHFEFLSCAFLDIVIIITIIIIIDIVVVVNAVLAIVCIVVKSHQGGTKQIPSQLVTLRHSAHHDPPSSVPSPPRLLRRSTAIRPRSFHARRILHRAKIANEDFERWKALGSLLILLQVIRWCRRHVPRHSPPHHPHAGLPHALDWVSVLLQGLPSQDQLTLGQLFEDMKPSLNGSSLIVKVPLHPSTALLILMVDH